MARRAWGRSGQLALLMAWLGVTCTVALRPATTSGQTPDRSTHYVYGLEHSPDYHVRVAAAEGLGAFPDDHLGLLALIRGLGEDSHPLVRAACATALGRAGTAASGRIGGSATIVEALRRAQSDHSPIVRRAVARAMEAIATAPTRTPPSSIIVELGDHD
jgi:hypothetical protein